MLKAVIFDMDGVLVNSEPFYMQRRADFLGTKGMEVPDASQFVGANGDRVWELMTPDVTASQREILREEYRRYRMEHPIPYDRLANPQAKPLMLALKSRGLQIGIASSSPRWMIERMMEMLSITPLVDAITSGEECAAHKPDPAVYIKAMQTLHVMPEETIAVEDSAVGIRAGIRAGIKVYGLKPLDGIAQDQSAAAGILDDLLDLLACLPE